MKKVLMSFVLGAALLLSGSSAYSQDSTSAGTDIKNAAKKTGKAIGKGAKKVGSKTAEIASKGKSKMVDKTYDGKSGPDGQTIYIDNKSKYYWVDKKGHHQYVEEGELKTKE